MFLVFFLLFTVEVISFLCFYLPLQQTVLKGHKIEVQFLLVNMGELYRYIYEKSILNKPFLFHTFEQMQLTSPFLSSVSDL